MSEQPRRGSEPARIWADNRVAFYPSGVAGVGTRKTRRTQNRDEAESLAHAFRAVRNPGGSLLETHFTEPLFMAMKAFLAHLEATGQPHGTISQYRSNFNTWMPKEVALARCCDLGLLHWNAIFTGAVRQGASVSTLNALRRTLGALATFGLFNSYFAEEPFGAARLCRGIVNKAKADAARRDGIPKGGIALDRCPTPDDIEEFADSFEVVYPGYGRRFVILSWCCGTRINETAALEAGDIDLENLLVHVDRQLDRYNPWPATRLPKNGKQRVAKLWQIGADTAESLIADSRLTGGRLFPPKPGFTMWSDELSHLATDAVRACSWNDVWTMHWTRHAYATYGLTPVTEGGYGLGLKSVQTSLGHERPSTTTDAYVQSVDHDVDTFRQLTSKRPTGPR